MPDPSPILDESMAGWSRPAGASKLEQFLWTYLHLGWVAWWRASEGLCSLGSFPIWILLLVLLAVFLIDFLKMGQAFALYERESSLLLLQKLNVRQLRGCSIVLLLLWGLASALFLTIVENDPPYATFFWALLFPFGPVQFLYLRKAFQWRMQLLVNTDPDLLSQS